MHGLTDEVRQMYETYKRQFGAEPTYADSEIRYYDNGKRLHVSIALFDYTQDIPDELDEQIFFYAGNIEGLLRLCEEAKEDFCIVDVITFSDSPN